MCGLQRILRAVGNPLDSMIAHRGTPMQSELTLIWANLAFMIFAVSLFGAAVWWAL